MRLVIQAEATSENILLAELIQKDGKPLFADKQALENLLTQLKHTIEYEVDPSTGAAVPVKIDGRHIMPGEPVRGEAPEWMRQKMAPEKLDFLLLFFILAGILALALLPFWEW